MTNRQYEKVGRAMCLVAELAEKVEALYPIRQELEGILSPLCGRDAAAQFVSGVCAESFPVMHLGGCLADVANAAKDKEERAK